MKYYIFELKKFFNLFHNKRNYKKITSRYPKIYQDIRKIFSSEKDYVFCLKNFYIFNLSSNIRSNNVIKLKNVNKNYSWEA